MQMRDHLLDLAESFSRTRGLDAFSYADLSTQAGITKAAVHHHFPTKAALSLAVLDRYTTRFLAALNTLEGGPGDRLAGFMGLYRNASNEGSCLCLCVAYGAVPGSLSAEVRDGVSAFHADILAWLKSTLAEAGRDGSEAALILATAEGAQLTARATGSAKAFDAACAPLLKILEI